MPYMPIFDWIDCSGISQGMMMMENMNMGLYRISIAITIITIAIIVHMLATVVYIMPYMPILDWIDCSGINQGMMMMENMNMGLYRISIAITIITIAIIVHMLATVVCCILCHICLFLTGLTVVVLVKG